MTEDLMPYYAEPHTVLVHSRGHMIPTDAAAKKAYKEFIAKNTTSNA